MTRLDLESRLAKLKEQQTQLIANLHAVAGAIQFAEQLLQEQEFDQPDVPPIDNTKE